MSKYTSNLEQWLKKQGWQLNCASPLEISLIDDPGGSQASGVAAEIVIDSLTEESGPIDAEEN